MKKLSLLIAALLAVVSLQSAEVNESSQLFGGVVSGKLKAMHILTDKTNSFTPEDGSGYLATLKYVTPELVNGLKLGAGLYVNGDTGLTGWDDNKKNALGMFVDEQGKDKALLGEAYLEYNSDKFNAKIGRQILNTPLTTIQWSLMPNFYEAAVLSTEAVDDFSFTLAHINRMSYGSRSATDWGLIGERTKTAGAARPMSTQSLTGIEQANFIDVGDAAVGVNTDGITAFNMKFNGIENMTLNVWDYYAYDIANMIYLDTEYKLSIEKGMKLTLGAQYLNQTNIGDDLVGELNYNMWGAKAKFGNKKYSTYIAYNKSNDNDTGGAFINPWGADPAYTSSLFSRNAYRQDVTAYKIGGYVTIIEGLKLMASYADYGKSKTIGWTTATATDDATETDIILIYKPNKAWMFKIFNAIRTSEYNTDAVERKMNHVRAIASFTF